MWASCLERLESLRFMNYFPSSRRRALRYIRGIWAWALSVLHDLELELAQYQMAQKPVLRGEVGAHVWRVCDQTSDEEGCVGALQTLHGGPRPEAQLFMQAHTPHHAAACSLVCTTRRPFPLPSGASDSARDNPSGDPDNHPEDLEQLSLKKKKAQK